MAEDGNAGTSVLDFQPDTGEERTSLEVNDLLELPEVERSTNPLQKGRLWFPDGGDVMSPAIAKTQPSSQALRRKGGTAHRIQQSLAKLDEVLSTQDPPQPSLLLSQKHVYPPPGSLFKTSLFPSREATPVRHTPSTSVLGVATDTDPTSVGSGFGTTTPPSHTPLTRQDHTRDPQLSMMDTTGVLRDLVMAPTPIQDKTQLPLSLSHSHAPSKLLLEDTILGSHDSTMLEDPVWKVGGDLIMAFHREFSSHSNPAQCLELAAALEKCCEVQWNILTEFEKQTKSSVSQMLSELRMEMATWQLVHVLCRDRVTEGMGEEMVTELLVQDTASDKDLVDEYFTRDSATRQAQLVIDWLEQSARASLEQFPVKVSYFADSVSWENTLHDITHGIDSGHVVSEMDPDAPTRQGRRLSELDIKDEYSLNKHLFTCIRAGHFEKALSICVSCGQPLKALMLEGWKLHHDPNIGRSMTDELDAVEGNEFRDVWKASCWEMLEEPTYDVYEKAIFAALSGNIQKILPACQSWYDYVWAYFKTMVDVRVEKKLRSRGRSDVRDLVALPPEYWNNILLPEVIFQEIEACPSPAIRKQCQIMFHTVQKYIILDDFTGLVDVMYGWLEKKLTIHQLRFMAHVCIIIRGLRREIEESKANAILEEYVKALTASHYSSTVALYASQLPAEPQVTCYAQLLAGVQKEDEQRQCLELGKEAGLDIAMVTKAVVENMRDMGVEEGMDSTTLGLGKEVELTQVDHSKIEVINWLVYEESQRAEAIKQGNALIRQFLAARKYTAAKAVFQKIPSDSVEMVKRDWQKKAGASPIPSDILSDIMEYLAIKTYLEAKEAFNLWFQHFHHKKPVSPTKPTPGLFREQVAYEHNLSQYELEVEQWLSQSNYLTEDASSKLYKVLVFSGGWMADEPHISPVNQVRSQQLHTLRQICLPEVCFLLHSILHSTAQYQKCLQIADVIASEKYALYKEFRKDELRKLLSMLHCSAMAVVDDQGTDELGYPAA